MPDLIPQVNDAQLLLLETLYRVFRETREWPNYQYVASVLDEREVDVNEVLETMPEGLYWPEKSLGGVVWFREDETLGLRVRGLACCRNSKAEIDCFLRAVRFVVSKRRETKPATPQAVVEPILRFADFIKPIEEVVGLHPEVYRVLLVLELMRVEPYLPSWEGSLDDPLQRQVRISRDVLRFRNVETLVDFLAALPDETGIGPLPDPAASLAKAVEALGVRPAPSRPDDAGDQVRADPERSVETASPPAATALPTPVVAAGVVLGIGANLGAVLLAPPPVGIAVLAASLTALLLFWRRPHVNRAVAALAILLAASVAAGLTALTVGSDWRDRVRFTSVSGQLDGVLAQAARERRYAVARRELPLRGPGASSSYFLVLRDEYLRDRFRTDVSSPISDEVRIYDNVEGTLELRLRFQPQNPGEVPQWPEGDHPGFLFRLDAIADYDGNGRKEIVGAFERYTLATGPLPVPVIVTWDDRARWYRLNALIPEPPDIQRPPGYEPAHDAYLAPTKILNQHGDQLLAWHASDHFDLAAAPNAPVFMAAYAEETSRGIGPRYEAKAWFVDLQTPRPQFTGCGPATRHLYIRADYPALVRPAMKRAFLARNSDCRQD